MANEQEPKIVTTPGVMGDGTGEQNLGQPGDPSNRIDKAEVEEAFGDNLAKD